MLRPREPITDEPAWILQPKRRYEARYDVILAIGKYAGAKLNQEPMTADEARHLANNGCQRGRPEMRLNFGASFRAGNNP